MLEAARDAAENAARSLAGSQASRPPSPACQDLKALEALTRRSDERNSKTFEAIHDTLMKIVDRLGSLDTDTQSSLHATERYRRRRPGAGSAKIEDAPSIDAEPMALGLTAATTPIVAAAGSPARSVHAPRRRPRGRGGGGTRRRRRPPEAEAAGRVRSMLGGLPRVQGQEASRRRRCAGVCLPNRIDMAPSVDLDAPLDPKIANRPLEPGSGAPDLNAIMKRVRDERGQPATAGDSDAAEVRLHRRGPARRPGRAPPRPRSETQDRHRQPGEGAAHRRPAEIAAQADPDGHRAVMLALAGLQLGKAFMQDPAGTSKCATPVAQSAHGGRRNGSARRTIGMDPAPAMADDEAGAGSGDGRH